MGRLVVGLVAGVIIGAAGTLGFGGMIMGGAMGAGAATGLAAGVCSIVEAVDQSGLVSKAQIGEILSIAAKNAQSVPGGETPAVSAADFGVEECRTFMTDLRAKRSS